MSFENVPLAEVCEINPKRLESIANDATVSFLGMADVSEAGTTAPGADRPFGDVRKGYTAFQDNDILLAKITPCFQNGKIAQARLARLQGAGSTEFHVLRGLDGRLDQRYMLHFLRRDQVLIDGERRMTGSGGQRRVPVQFLETLQIPLPPLPEQRRIAAILDHADALRAKRRESVGHLAELSRSIFIEMFGDPERLAGGMIPLGSVSTISSGSTPKRSDPALYGGDTPWVKTGEVKNEVIHATEECVTDEGVRQARLKTYSPGAILVAMYGQGATRGRVGLLGVRATTNQACAVVEPDAAVLSEFVFDQLKFSYERLRGEGRGGNQPNLNGQLVADFPVYVPALAMQTDYLHKRTALGRVMSSMKQELESLDTLFSSLQSRAFRGEL
ncbi:restriction endonuclease subunit S [Gordonia sp. DT218]|uniref:restriction endonuclease subunit S n=1 Tax=Gordonia sp. DT218 TaxID=3416659 RepID=UPI003CEDE1A4